VENLKVFRLETKTLIYNCAAAFITIFVIAGCSDNPQNKAAKQLRQSAEKAFDIASSQGDYEKASKAVQTALRNASEAGAAAEPVLLASGNLTFERAQRLQSELVTFVDSADIALDEISAQARKISSSQIRQEQLSTLLAGMNGQIEELSKIISGDGDNVGIEEQLAAADAELSWLEEQNAGFEQQKQQAQDYIESIQQQADEKLRQAEVASGDEKLKLQHAGYEFLLSKKSYFLEAQGALDQIRAIESQIAIVEPSAQKLQADLVAVQQQIDDIRKSPQRGRLKTQLEDVKKQIKADTSRIVQLTASLKRARDSYCQAAEEIISLFQQAAKDYQKIKLQAVRRAAAVGLADCYGQMALAALDNMRFQEYLSSRLQAAANAVEDQTASTLSEIASQYAKATSDYAQKAKEEFDRAIEEYSKVQKRFGSRKDGFACDVIKNYILVLYGKMVLSEYLAEFDIIDEVLAQADELMEKARACDSRFSRSVTARLLEGSAQYTPSMAIDSTMYYEQLKEQFQDWKKLRGEEKEAEVQRLLAMLDGMGEPEDLGVFNRIIGPERQRLEEALARGFKEEDLGAEGYAEDSGAGYGEDYSDPNYF
jgi:hypothetical protein